jgi:hypothetical protein
MNLEWLKKHPYAAAGAILVGIIVIYLVLRKGGGSSTSGLGSAIAAQNQGQLQMAQLNAQLSAQSQQTQAQLAAQELQTQAQTQAQQDAIAGQVATEILPIQAEAPLYQLELQNEFTQQQEMLPLEQQAIGQVGKGGSLETAGLNELEILASEGAVPGIGGLNNLPGGTRQPSAWSGFLTGLGTSLGAVPAGLFA